MKKWIGALAAALDGLDTLVFAGGIGENARLVRSRLNPFSARTPHSEVALAGAI